MKKLSYESMLVHGDRKFNKPACGAVHESTNNSVLFEFSDVADLEAVFQGKQAGHVYSRSSSNSSVSLQVLLNEFDKGIGSICFSSGMAAISATFLSLLRAGDHIIVSQFLFGNTRSLMDMLESFGVQITYVDVTDSDCVKPHVKSNTRLVFCETIANPVTQVSDLQGIGSLCSNHNLVFVVDNTMTPSCMFNPHSVSASLLVTSLTKYVAGHGNVLGGVVIDLGNFDWAKFPNISDKYKVSDVTQWGLTQIKKRGLRDIGATLAPQSAAQISVGLETLSLRMNKTCANALKLAEYLMNCDKVSEVYYPGLVQHPQHMRAKALFNNNNFGGVLSFTLNEGLDIRAFLNSLELVIKATHLGDNRTLALPVATTIFYENGLDLRREMGISESLIRISVGIEEIDDIFADFSNAFENIRIS